jgi:hypothetical protein
VFRPLGFGAVECEVGVLQQCVRIAAISRGKRNTDADADLNMMAVKIVGLADLVDNARRKRARIQRSERGDDGKFVSAQAGDGIGLSNAGVQSVCCHLQHRIADRMTQRIVHGLEAIKIQTEHGEMPVRASRQRRLDSFAQQDPIGQSGKRVMMRHIGNLSFSTATFGDVLVSRYGPAIQHRPGNDGDAAAVVQLAVKRALLSVAGTGSRGLPDSIKRLVRHQSRSNAIFQDFPKSHARLD